jgi:transcriptional regulator with XRE-family HTH domain
VLVAPGHTHVYPLEPEFITPQDGSEKQDCERNAAKRWVERNGCRFAPWQATILADDLHCHQPFCTLLAQHQLNYILVCKPDSHPTLYEEIELLQRIEGLATFNLRLWNGRFAEQWQCRYVNQVPLRSGPDALLVNWCEVAIYREDTGARLYFNTFITNFELTHTSVRPIVQSGRARWKVENENNNVLKNYGYHLEHNYGHGQRYLAAVLVSLNLLAFLMHTILDQTHDLYRRIRQELGWSQAERAGRSGVRREWVTRFEHGKATVELELVLRVVTALGLHLTVHTGDFPVADTDQPHTDDLDDLLGELDRRLDQVERRRV